MDTKDVGDEALNKISIQKRKSKVGVEDFANIPHDLTWLENLELMIPNILAGKDLKDLSKRVIEARNADRPVIIMMGAHPVKCGLSRLINTAIDKGLITAIAMNGACAIHDVEIGLWGKTSEDVEASLASGGFGVTQETISFFNRAIKEAYVNRIGLGEAVCRSIGAVSPPFQELSILANAHKSGLTVTIHVAIGTDIIHQHPEADGEQIGYATMKDFRIFAKSISELNGGVVLNIGSAVIMPEVFLKAMAIARNRNIDLGDFTTANFDMFQMYRPTKNVVDRPRLLGARSFNFIGQHEILLPVFFGLLLYRSSH